MKKIAIISIIGVVVFVLLGGLGKFFIDAIYEKRERLITIQEEIQKMEARQQNLKDLEALFGEVQKREKDIENIFVSERSVVRVIEALEARARDLAISLRVDSASLPTASATRGPEIQIRLSGSFDALYRYIKILEVLPFQLSIDVLHVSMSDTAEEWSSTIKLTVLSFMPQL
ncbi:MAG: hypothetical protein Q8O83_01425 [bacterium]|nr:hypothetical protein [bacterium]